MPRRDAAQRLDDSVERMWRVYADEIGIPGAVSAASKGALPKQDHTSLPARRPARRSVWSFARIVAGVAAMAVSVAALVVVWQRPPFSAETSERPPAIVASPAPTGERIVAQRTMIANAQIGERAQSNRRDMLYQIRFAFDSDRIADDSKPGLDNIVVAMKANPNWLLSIEGHTDAYGSPDHNQWLSERRAHAVEAYFRSSGIAAERLSIVALSALRPAAPNDAAGDILNRRVEIYRR